MLVLDTKEWLLVAVGFFGALTLVYLIRRAYASWRTPSTITCHFSPKGGCTDMVVRNLQRPPRSAGASLLLHQQGHQQGAGGRQRAAFTSKSSSTTAMRSRNTPICPS